MLRSAPVVHRNESDEKQRRQGLGAFGTPQQVALGSQIVLAVSEGQSDKGIARRLEIHCKTVM